MGAVEVISPFSLRRGRARACLFLDQIQSEIYIVVAAYICVYVRGARNGFFPSRIPRKIRHPPIKGSRSSEPSGCPFNFSSLRRRANCSELMQNRCRYDEPPLAAGSRNLRNGEPQIDPRAYVSNEGIIIEEGRATLPRCRSLSTLFAPSLTLVGQSFSPPFSRT